MDEFAALRGERRSFFCHNNLWQEIQQQTGDCMSISTYIRQALIEKMIRDMPEKAEYFHTLSGNAPEPLITSSSKA